MRNLLRVATVALATLVIGFGLATASAVEAVACSPGDRPEPGVQGQVPLADEATGASRQGYSCNIRRVASNDINGRGGDWQLTWYDRCAYRSTPTPAGDGVAILDVANARRPRLVKVLHEAAWTGRGGTLGIHEGLHASVRRGVLVVPIGTLVSVYDLRADCTKPRHTADFDIGYGSDPLKQRDSFPPNMGIHSGKLSADGTFYYATDLGNGLISPTGPCITVVDLANLRRPRLTGRFGVDFPCHDLELSPDGTRAYVGFYSTGPGYEAAIAAAFTSVFPPSYLLTGLRILDTTDVQRRRANPQVRIVGELTGGRQHTETFTRIKGRSYIIGGEEAVCPGGNGRIVDITDEAHPVAVAELPLEVNRMPNCGTAKVDRDESETRFILGYMTHYISVDNRNDASLAFISWYNSGLRVFDIHDPHHPREVAYYNPPVGQRASASHDTTMTYSRYDAATGRIWFGSLFGGFYVVELAPTLRPRTKGVRVSRTWSVGRRANSQPVRASAAARSAGGPQPGELHYHCSLVPSLWR